MLEELKVVVADIDNTLVPKGEGMMPITREALTILHEHGVLFGLATGRAFDTNMRHRAEFYELPFDIDFFITMNGGQLWDRFHQELQEEFRLEPDVLHEAMEMMRPLGLNCSIYEGDKTIALYMDDVQAGSVLRNNAEVVVTNGDIEPLCASPTFKFMFRYDASDTALRDKILAHVEKHLSEHPDLPYRNCITYPGIMEILHKDCNKSVSLRKFSQINQIPLEQIMAFGDMDNDNEMLEAAGWGVALKNAIPETKAVADAVTEYDVEEDGMGRYLFDHWIIPHGWDK